MKNFLAMTGLILLVGCSPCDDMECATSSSQKNIATSGSTKLTATPKKVVPPKVFPAYAKYRTAYNYCTYGYTFSYWTWDEWKIEIDRLADNGINQALLLPGHEKVWQNTLRRVGMTDTDIFAFIPEPPFAPWWLMGNLEGMGGPVSQNTIDYQAKLGRQMADYMREKGIQPIVNGFVGVVPTTLKKYLPNAHIIDQGRWAGGCIRPAVLSPLDSEFSRMAQIWYEEVKNVYGEINFFGGDLFHEGGKRGGLKITDCARNLQKEMLAANPNAIYVLQGWGGNPGRDLLKGLDNKKIMVQNLVQDMYQMGGNGGNQQPYTGAAWTFALVNNFGGNTGLYGSLPAMAAFPEKLAARKDTEKFQGFALLDEGFQRNPVNEALWYHVMTQTKNVDLKAFLKNYTMERYGKDASDIFMFMTQPNHVYGIQSNQQGVCDFCIAAHPTNGGAKARYWCGARPYWKLSDLITATDSLLALNAQSSDYDFDVVDCVRQILDRHALDVRNQVMDAFKAKDKERFDAKMKHFMAIFDASADICATHPKFLADCSAQKFGAITGDAERHSRALNQLHSSWVPRVGTDLDDYASRGNEFIIREYYKKRWLAWGENLREQLNGTKPPKVNYQAITTAYINMKNVKRPSTAKTRDVALKIMNDFRSDFAETLKRIEK